MKFKIICFLSTVFFLGQFVTPVAFAQAQPQVTDGNSVEIEAARIAAAMTRDVPKQVVRTPEQDALWVERAKATLSAAGTDLRGPQMAVVVDRNPQVQEMRLMVLRGDGPWLVLGGTKVSTGQAGRFDHFITPTGVFVHSSAILDYRAEGTYNENHIRGYGVKGMRVWDLGWQNAPQGWRKDGRLGEMRLEMHATDPDVLEPRLGHTASQGCIRIPAALNRFFDINGVVDADYEQAALTDRRYGEVLRRDRTPSSIGGRAIIVFDSSGT